MCGLWLDALELLGVCARAEVTKSAMLRARKCFGHFVQSESQWLGVGRGEVRAHSRLLDLSPYPIRSLPTSLLLIY